jgi:hypothetical protein
MFALSLDEPDDPATRVLLERARGQFTEMPGLRLNLKQAQRLWGLDSASCEEILESLVETGVLVRTRDYAYVLRRGRA